MYHAECLPYNAYAVAGKTQKRIKNPGSAMCGLQIHTAGGPITDSHRQVIRPAQHTQKESLAGEFAVGADL